MRLWPGQPYGATWTGLGINFALYSAHASKVERCLFDSVASTQPSHCVPLPEQTDMVRHGELPDIRSGQLYRLPAPRSVRTGLGKAFQSQQDRSGSVDNESYRLVPEDRRYYQDFTGSATR